MKEKTIKDLVQDLIYKMNQRTNYLEDAIELESKYQHNKVADNFSARKSELSEWQHEVQIILNFLNK